MSSLSSVFSWWKGKALAQSCQWPGTKFLSTTWAPSWMAPPLTPAETEERSSLLSWAKVSFPIIWEKTWPPSRRRQRFHPSSLCACAGQVIKAWDIGVATMKEGELCQLICKPEYAYGSAGSPPKIPPDSTLIFEVSLDMHPSWPCYIIGVVAQRIWDIRSTQLPMLSSS